MHTGNVASISAAIPSRPSTLTLDHKAMDAALTELGQKLFQVTCRLNFGSFNA
jgi:hypothetical protein